MFEPQDDPVVLSGALQLCIARLEIHQHIVGIGPAERCDESGPACGNPGQLVTGQYPALVQHVAPWQDVALDAGIAHFVHCRVAVGDVQDIQGGIPYNSLVSASYLNDFSMDISDLRREYMYAGLSRDDLDDDPVNQFEQWFLDAQQNGLDNPNALSLATAGADGMPSVRTVLLKAFDGQGFVFYTNYGSRKAREIAENPQAAMLFHWLEFDRQVKIQGPVCKVSAAESLKYFSTRPRGSQIGAWCSEQSSPIGSRTLLVQAYESIKTKFEHGEIPLPDFWGGYRVEPIRIEFWQGRENRLHDRFEYVRDGDGWTIQRLAP